ESSVRRKTVGPRIDPRERECVSRLKSRPPARCRALTRPRSGARPLTTKFVNDSMASMEPLADLEVIDDPATAVVALDPIRARLLSELAEPGSAASLAGRVGLTRQKVNYHLRALEAHGLVRPVEHRRWGGIVERRVVATAASYIVSPAALGDAANDPARASDRLSARYVIALAARVVTEVGELLRRSKQQG